MNYSLLKIEEMKVLVEFYKQELSKLHGQRDDILWQIDTAEHALLTLQGAIAEHEHYCSEPEQYSHLWTLAKKCEYVLRSKGKTMSISEIAEEILKLGGVVPMHTVEKKIINAIASTLKQKVDKKDTFLRLSHQGVYVYGLLPWKDEMGRMRLPSGHLI